MNSDYPNPEKRVSRRRALQAAGGASLGLAVAGSVAGDAGSGRAAAQAPDGPAEPIAELMRGPGLDARDFGARFDNATDDAAALQRAIDAAHEQKRALLLPGGTAVLARPLSLVGRDVSIIGQGMTHTVLRAGGKLATLIDVEEQADRIVSPFALMRLTLDGAGTTQRNLAIRFRHYSWLFEVNSVAADTGIWERDTWLSRREGCRTGDNRVGWHLAGSNHASLYERCTMTACEEMHLFIDNHGSAPDGNMALTFRTCDVEFGKGHGIEVAVAANVGFEGCYLGENIGGDVLRNRGFVSIDRGVYFFGFGGGVGVRPLGGVARLNEVSINGQRGGIATLINLAPEEAVAEGGHGKVAITNANANLPVGGDPVLQGDPLERVPMEVYAPRLGRDWKAWAEFASISEARSPEGLPDGREVTAKSGRGWFGLRAALTPARWRETAPVYFACVYRSTAPFQLRLRVRENTEGNLAVNVPASPSVATYVNVSMGLPADDFGFVEVAMPATPGARLGLQELTLGDGTTFRTPSGNLKTLALAQ